MLYLCPAETPLGFGEKEKSLLGGGVS